MPPIDNIGSFSGFPQSVPSSAAGASSSAGASEGAGRARSDTEFLELWDEWEWNAPQGGGEQRDITARRLRDCLERKATELDLSDLKLTSLPELPSHVEILKIHDNSLIELPTLPDSLKKLIADDNKLTHLPEPLPSSLEVLSTSENKLAELPALPLALRRLVVFRNKLTHLPEPLPPSLQILSASGNQLTELPALPLALRDLHVASNQLTHLSEPLPSSLEVLIASENQLAELPALPLVLRDLHVDSNQLTHLPDSLPSSLEVLSATENRLGGLPALPSSLRELSVSRNQLTELPALPPSLEHLAVGHNQLTSLPDELPGSLRHIGCQGNRLTQLPESISRLPNTGRIFAESNPFSERTIQALQNLRGDPGYHGPTVYFSMQVSASRPARPLEEAVAAWLPSESEAKAAGRWEAIAKEDGAPAFSAFLDHLQDTISAQRVPGFKEQVAAWLTRLSETPALREKTFLVSVGATESCQDRVALTWNNMQKAELEHRIACGACDQNLPEVVSAGREMFRLEQLDQIAREKAGTLRFVDEIEVHLAFQTKLRDSLGLSSATREMFFYNVSGVTQDDLKAAELRVKTAEDSTFSDWFCLWTPWHAVLQRIAPEGWGQAATIRLKSHETDYQSRVEAELRALDLEGDLDAERTIGKKVMNEIDLEAFGPLTKAVLAGRNQTELLDSQWKI